MRGRGQGAALKRVVRGHIEYTLSRGRTFYRVEQRDVRHDDAFSPLRVTWSFKTREAAEKGFEYMRLFDLTGETVFGGGARDGLMKAFEKVSEEMDEVCRRLGDFPPGSAGAAEMDGAAES